MALNVLIASAGAVTAAGHGPRELAINDELRNPSRPIADPEAA